MTLFKRLKKREEHAFTEFMNQHKEQLYKTAYSYFKNESDSLEAVQEVTYRAYVNIHKVKQPQFLKTWLIRIMINYCLDELRKSKRSKVGVTDNLSDLAASDPDITRKMMVQEALQKLSEGDQLIVILKYFHQYTLAEIADSLELPLGTVKTRLHRALEALRNGMDKGSDAI